MRSKLPFMLVMSILIMTMHMHHAKAQTNWLTAGNNIANGYKLGSVNNRSLILVTNNNERMRIDSLGNITVGLNSGSTKFLQFGTSATMKFPQNQYIFRHSNSSEGLFNNQLLHRIEYRDPSAVPTMWIEWLSSGNSYFKGNMGIGTTTPEGKLHVLRGSAGTVTANANSPFVVENNTHNYMSVLAPAASEKGVLFGDPSNAQNGGIIYTGTNQLHLRTNGNTTRMTIDFDGNTGINLDPLNFPDNFSDALLQVKSDGDDNLSLISLDNANNWSMYSEDAGSGNLAFYKNGDFRGSFNSSSGIYTASDRRLKKDVISLSNIMESVMRLQPKKYHFIQNDGGTKYNYGFIAQEVNEVFPEFVGSYKDRKTGEERLTLNYDNFSVIAIKAIQEQQKQIEQQKKEIESLKESVKNLAQMQSKLITTSTISEAAKTDIVLTDAALEQNKPNPLRNTTSIRYNIPNDVKNAQLIITDPSGKRVKQLILNMGTGIVNMDASALINGTYNYSLVIDGRIIESKTMIVAH